MYRITEVNNDAMPGYHLDLLPERYYEALLKKRTKLTMKEKKGVMKALSLIR